MSKLEKKMDLEEKLRENLERFCSPPEVEGNLFIADREIAIARYALNCQFEAYAKTIEILTVLLEHSAAKAAVDPRELTNIMTCISTIELKSSQLIEATKSVTEILGNAVNIDIDKAALRTMVLQLPSLVKQSITALSGNDELADSIALNLSNRIDNVMQQLRFEPTSVSQSTSQTGALTLEQYHEMICSVPTQP